MGFLTKIRLLLKVGFWTKILIFLLKFWFLDRKVKKFKIWISLILVKNSNTTKKILTKNPNFDQNNYVLAKNPNVFFLKN